uniref:Protein FAM33A n=1 Tax=Podarcis muralis TaxID=64176 RepID=A0A670JG57_PODMU
MLLPDPVLDNIRQPCSTKHGLHPTHCGNGERCQGCLILLLLSAESRGHPSARFQHQDVSADRSLWLVIHCEVEKLTSPSPSFQKAESDLDYIQAMLEFEMVKGHADGLSKENPLVVIQQLSQVKSRYKMLCEQLERISTERRESMRLIRATLAKTMKLVQEIQQHTGMEVALLSCLA